MVLLKIHKRHKTDISTLYIQAIRNDGHIFLVSSEYGYFYYSINYITGKTQ